LDVLIGSWRAGDEFRVRHFISGGDGKASSSSDKLMLGPTFRPVVEATPEGSQLTLNLERDVSREEVMAM
jgi:hypothetical protein